MSSVTKSSRVSNLDRQRTADRIGLMADVLALAVRVADDLAKREDARRMVDPGLLPDIALLMDQAVLDLRWRLADYEVRGSAPIPGELRRLAAEFDRLDRAGQGKGSAR